uniref:Uncharacterized protein n=1 Tax=Oryza rufipogon TaxID=4529 RepID=A0A0E0N134_ORYRU
MYHVLKLNRYQVIHIKYQTISTTYRMILVMYHVIPIRYQTISTTYWVILVRYHVIPIRYQTISPTYRVILARYQMIPTRYQLSGAEHRGVVAGSPILHAPCRRLSPAAASSVVHALCQRSSPAAVSFVIHAPCRSSSPVAASFATTPHTRLVAGGSILCRHAPRRARRRWPRPPLSTRCTTSELVAGGHTEARHRRLHLPPSIAMRRSSLSEVASSAVHSHAMLGARRRQPRRSSSLATVSSAIHTPCRAELVQQSCFERDVVIW